MGRGQRGLDDGGGDGESKATRLQRLRKVDKLVQQRRKARSVGESECKEITFYIFLGEAKLSQAKPR